LENNKAVKKSSRIVMVMHISIAIYVLAGCQTAQKAPEETHKVPSELFLGADLSYVNEMLDCGGIYRKEGKVVEPYQLFAEEGNNLVRLRLWHNPDWTSYSDYEDVKLAIKRSKKLGMSVLLDFHYSDDWADPNKQLIPKAWKEIVSLKILGDSVYNYTSKVLTNLNESGLLPNMVQIGNETNVEILMPLESKNYDSINWERNIYLINRGITAVNDVSKKTGKHIATMIHIAQPENAEWWFPKAFEYGIIEFDWIGLSYYPKWSDYSLSQLAEVISLLKKKYSKRIMVVETAYPATLQNADDAGNLLAEDALLEGFSATPLGQKDFMIALTKIVIEGGGEGVIYWEPAWISVNCSTRWGNGSHWDNATFFDAQNGNEALTTFGFYERANYSKN